ncbi:class I SAM-dependent methyltransferase [Candidatus Thiosymbion oneisti]|uniref:class I SAM-dependent methyltransferase n=1 Tax=Candidatus Thiosymbion oneisti TaxID=589554 RepID=UPI00159F1CB4|nr:class I SAM-dependent methyltransferase [Candidatus Thiosymbion oneisti]
MHNDVPDMFNQYTISSSAEVGENLNELADAIAQVLMLEEKSCSEKVLEINKKASRYSCSDAEITAEINELRSRFIPQCRPVFPDIPPDANKSPKLEMERHYFPRRIVSGETIIANVRVKNCGQFVWSSRTDHGLKFSVSWIDGENQRVAGLLVPINFPIDIDSGRSITIPVTTQAPRKPGVYRVHACLLDWQLRIVAEARSGIKIQVDSAFKNTYRRVLGLEKTISQPQFFDTIPDYGKDHSRAVDLFDDEIKKLKRTPTRIIEVGSGTSPHAVWTKNCQILALDISSPLLELGSLYHQKHHPFLNVAFLCANAYEPPLKTQAFDSVVMFSTLHHFPEPEVVLKKLSQLIKLDGFLAVMCEPINDNLNSPDTVRDLLNGINEQVFSWREYQQIFEMAGLTVSRMIIDGASLKAILKRVP